MNANLNESGKSSLTSALFVFNACLGFVGKGVARKYCSFAVLYLLLSASPTIADQFDHLTPRVSGVSTALNAVAFGTSNYVAVGDGGVLLRTQDTLDWEREASPATNDLLSVAFGGGLFVAAGKGGTILTSSDGESWTAQASTKTNDLRGIAFGGGTFVAVGAAGTILVSSNGVNWSARVTGVPYGLNGITYGLADIYGNYRFVAVGDSGTIMTSQNGSAWTIRPSVTFLDLYGVALGVIPAGGFVAVGQAGLIATSSDTATWTVQDSGTLENLRMVAVDPVGYYSGPLLRNGPAGTIGAVGDHGTFVTSSDGGLTWSAQITETTNHLRGVTFENGGFLAVGDRGTVQGGFIWVRRNSGVTTSLNSIARGVNRFVVVGALGTVVTSPDGANWQSVASGTVNNLAKVVWGGDRFVAVGGGGVVITSTNGLDWNSQIVAGGSNLTSVAYGNGIFVAIGYAVGGGRTCAIRSTNGVNWLPAPPALPGDVAFGANLFCVVFGAWIYTSSDGLQWFEQNSPYPNLAGGVSYAGGKFVAAGSYIIDSGAQMVTSTDGTNWIANPSQYFYAGSCCWGHNAYVGAGGGAYLTSPDGVHWTSRGPHSVAEATLSLSSVAFGAGKFVAVGDGGLIVEYIPTPSILSVRSAPQGAEVVLTGDIGRTFVLETAPDLTQKLWTNLWSVGNAPFRTNYFDTKTNASQRFYRSREL